MANAFDWPLWIIDTGSSTLTADLTRVKGIRWVGASAAGHQAILTNTAGKVMWESVASGANYVESDNVYSRPGLNWQGIKVTTLSSGKLEIELI